MDARTSEITGEYDWHTRLQRGLPLLPISGGDDPPKDPKDPPEGETVPKAQLEAAQALAAKRERIAREKQAEAARLKADQDALLEALGIELPDDPEERKQVLETLKTEGEKKRAGKTLSKEEVDRLLGERDKKHSKELDGLKTVSERRKGKLRELLITNEATLAGAELRATDGGLEAVRLIIEREADIIEDDETGEMKAVIKGKDGPRLNAKGEHMTVRERVEEIANDAKYGAWFQASGHRGAGSKGSGLPAGAKKRMTRQEIDALPLDERVKAQDQVARGEVQLVS